MAYDCSKLKAGDRVWVGKLYSDGSGLSLKSVAKVTPTQIVIDWNGNGRYLTRYKKDEGWPIGAGVFAASIFGLATPTECARWDAKQERERQAERAKADAEAATEKKRLELNGLFAAPDPVHKEQWGNSAERAGKWTVEFHNLTEDQVRQLAKDRKAD
jgi:hypothetical protein